MDERLMTYVKILNVFPSNAMLAEKRELCVALNGKTSNKLNQMSKWNRSLHPETPDIIDKPQYIHSAAAIYLLVKYPHLRPKDSFVNIIIGSNLQEECLNIAIHILQADEDCHSFLINSDNIFATNKQHFLLIDESKK